MSCQLSCQFRLCGLLLSLSLATPLSAQEEAVQWKDLGFYRHFLRQAQIALDQKQGAEEALKALALCPKELRHFEWHYLNAMVHARGFTIRGRAKKINAIAVSPDNNLLASVSSDHTARLWDSASGKALRTLKGHEGPVRCAAFSPRGKQLATGSNDMTVRLWDVDSGKHLVTISHHKEVVEGVTFSPDGAWLASFCRDGVIHIQDIAK